MGEGRSVFGRLAHATLRTCVRGLVLAVVAVAGLPLFIVSLFSLLSLAAGIGIVLAPKSLLARAGAGQQAAPLGAGMVGGEDRDALPAPAGGAHQRADRRGCSAASGC